MKRWRGCGENGTLYGGQLVFRLTLEIPTQCQCHLLCEDPQVQLTLLASCSAGPWTSFQPGTQCSDFVSLCGSFFQSGHHVSKWGSPIASQSLRPGGLIKNAGRSESASQGVGSKSAFLTSCLPSNSFFFYFLFYIGVWLINNVIVSGVQQNDSVIHIHVSILVQILFSWASLVAQWLRVCLPMQGTRVRALVWEDPTCHGATEPVSHSYWACASGACAPQRERPRWWEARAPRWRVAPACHN